MDTGRILVVDDDAYSRSMLSEYFTGFEHEVVTAHDGENALVDSRKKDILDKYA